jgi:hypothetical protein
MGRICGHTSASHHAIHRIVTIYLILWKIRSHKISLCLVIILPLQ